MMRELTDDPDRRAAVKSLSLQDILSSRPPLLARTREVAKTGLMIWGAISLSAAAGYAAMQFHGTAGPLLQTDRQHLAERLARQTTPEPSDTPSVATEALEVAAAERAAEVQVVDVAMARLPRPRPDEPIVTGSISRIAPQPYARIYRRERYDDPCEAWNSLGTPFRFRCIR